MGAMRAAMEKEVDLGRMKMSAAHASDVTMLQVGLECF